MHVTWVWRWVVTGLSELRHAGTWLRLTEIVALAQDASEQNEFALRVRYAANKTLGLWEMRPVEPERSTSPE